MKKNSKSADESLHNQAEVKLSGDIKKKKKQPMKEADSLRLLHELQVHQIELEMQNEELTRAQAEVKTEQDQYANLYNKLYDFAPVGYFTLGRDGTILHTNLTGARLLGVARSNLDKQRFETFLSAEFQSPFKDFLQKVFTNHGKKTFEAALLKGQHEKCWVHLEAAIEDEKSVECQIVLLDITDRKQAEEALKQSEAHYHLLADYMTDTIWLMNFNLQLTYVSPSVEKIRGYTSAELQQMQINQLLAPKSLELAMSVFSTEISRILTDPTYAPVYTLELDFYRRDGSLQSVESKLSILRDQNGNAISILGQDRDITERKQAEQALKASTEFSSSLIASMQDGLSVLDKNGIHVDVNSALCTMTGFSREELIGSKPPYLYWAVEDYERIQAAFQQVINGEFQNFELTFMRKNGERFPAIVSPFPVKDDLGNIVNYSATVKDITQRKQAELELQRHKEELELSNIQQAEHLQKLYESDIERTEKRRLQLALDLHDIVLNQLAILRLSVDDTHITPNFEEAYEQVTRRLREIVTDLRPPMLSYGLKLAIEGMADNMMDRNKETLNVVFDLQIAGEYRYAEHIEQYLFRIVQEACENALRHSHATRVKISAKLKPEHVWFLIEDNGKGFQPEGQIDMENLLANKHFGLVGMMERAMLIGAKAEVHSFLGKGTKIQVAWDAHLDQINRQLL